MIVRALACQPSSSLLLTNVFILSKIEAIAKPRKAMMTLHCRIDHNESRLGVTIHRTVLALCHCEEASDEAIPTIDLDGCFVIPDCFVGSLLAMTQRERTQAKNSRQETVLLHPSLNGYAWVKMEHGNAMKK